MKLTSLFLLFAWEFRRHLKRGTLTREVMRLRLTQFVFNISTIWFKLEWKRKWCICTNYVANCYNPINLFPIKKSVPHCLGLYNGTSSYHLLVGSESLFHTITIAANGSEFSHKVWISIFLFYVPPLSLRNLTGSHRIVPIHVYIILLRNTKCRSSLKIIAGVISRWFKGVSSSKFRYTMQGGSDCHVNQFFFNKW